MVSTSTFNASATNCPYLVALSTADKAAAQRGLYNQLLKTLDLAVSSLFSRKGYAQQRHLAAAEFKIASGACCS
jgi:hypothetical protein